jgi:hypothetical protein
MELGIPGVSIASGDHLCAFYFGRAERDAVMLPFLRAGLRAGDRCLCVVDSPEIPDVLASIDEDADDGIDVAGCVASQQLDVRKSSAAYLRTGTFSPEGMISFLDETVGDATTTGGVHFFRTTGETGWALEGAPGVEELIDYESELNRFVPRYPQAILCLYDLERFGGGMMVDLLRTHPKILLGGLVLENPHYLSPDEFRALRQ